jgi:hypothetical protein
MMVERLLLEGRLAEFMAGEIGGRVGLVLIPAQI